MKIDMHCHVREGSIDSKVPIEEFIKKLQSKGIGGMLVTDHDTGCGAHSDHYATGSKDAPSGAERASAFAAD